MKKIPPTAWRIAGTIIICCLAGFPSESSGPNHNNRPNNACITCAQAPRIIIEEKLIPEQTIVYVTDSASSYAGITQKFIQIIPAELGGFLKKNGLKMMGAPCAWYNGNKTPFVFDIGVPVNKTPSATEGRIKIKALTAGNAVVAHFYGPYDLTSQGYMAVETWLKEHNKKATGAPYEVYLGDPGIEKDPYKVLTDIIFPVE